MLLEVYEIYLFQSGIITC